MITVPSGDVCSLGAAQKLQRPEIMKALVSSWKLAHLFALYSR